MNEKLIVELVAIIAGLIWLLRLTMQQQDFKKNHIHQIEDKVQLISEKVARLEEKMNAAEKQIEKLFELNRAKK